MTEAPPQTIPPKWPRASFAWSMVGLLFLAGIFSVIDRAVLNIIVDPVRHDLAISDEQIGLLHGLAFGLFYAVMGVPMGLLADRVSRKWLVAGGMALWSMATMASGLAQTFGQLFAARLLVGLGEAALGPSAISLIADLFAPAQRGRPLSIYMMGQGLANGIALSITGLILNAASAGKFSGLPVVSDLAPWRSAFFLCGAAGLIVAVALAAMREPPRLALVEPPTGHRIASDELRFLWRNRGRLAPLYFGFALCFLVAYGAAAWAPTMLTRGFGATPALIGAWLGPMTMIFATLGPLIAGNLLDRSMRQNKPATRYTILMLAPVCAIPASLAVFVGDARIAMLLIASSSAAFAAIGTVMFATLQLIMPPQMRGFAVSLTLILNTFIGATLGPLLIATITQRVFHNPAAVGWSIAIVALPCLLAGSWLFWLAKKAMVKAG